MTVRLLALSVMSGRIGYAVFDGETLKDWSISRKAARSEEHLRDVLHRWLDDLAPNAVVTEELTPRSKKRGRSVRLLSAIRDCLAERGVLHVRIVRDRPFKTKYVEAAHLVERFPALQPWQPVRTRFYDNEPHSVVIFEAVALALQVLRAPTRHFASAMG
jgi:hypothetical protein